MTKSSLFLSMLVLSFSLSAFAELERPLAFRMKLTKDIFLVKDRSVTTTFNLNTGKEIKTLTGGVVGCFQDGGPNAELTSSDSIYPDQNGPWSGYCCITNAFATLNRKNGVLLPKGTVFQSNSRNRTVASPWFVKNDKDAGLLFSSSWMSLSSHIDLVDPAQTQTADGVSINNQYDIDCFSGFEHRKDFDLSTVREYMQNVAQFKGPKEK